MTSKLQKTSDQIGQGAADWGTQCPTAPAAEATKCEADVTALAPRVERPNRIHPRMRDFHVGLNKEEALYQHRFK